MKIIKTLFLIGMVWQIIEAIGVILGARGSFVGCLASAALCLAGAELAVWLAAAEEDRKKQLEILTEIRDALKPGSEKTE